MSIDFTGQVAVVTGAGNGLGRSYALDLARRGAAVVVNDIGVTADGDAVADRVVHEIITSGGRAVAATQSVTDPDAAGQVIDAALTAFGGIDVLINNAGFLRNALFADLTLDEIDAVIGVHLRAAFLVTQPAWRHMQTHGGGRIVMTASSAGAFGLPTQANYGAAKSGLLGRTRVLALEGEPYGIRVNAILPYARTGIAAGTNAAGLGNGRDLRQELGEMFARMSPETVTPLAVYLASQECSVSGEAFSALAGRYARVFTAVTTGWATTDPVTAEDIAVHLDDIERRDDHHVPLSLPDEMRHTARTFAGS